MSRSVARVGAELQRTVAISRKLPRPKSLGPLVTSLRFQSNMSANANMLRSNRLAQVFREGQRSSMGLWQLLPGSNVSRILARTGGVDWVMVDCEHGNIDGRKRPGIWPMAASRTLVPGTKEPRPA
jgi:hypothetical protein